MFVSLSLSLSVSLSFPVVTGRSVKRLMRTDCDLHTVAPISHIFFNPDVSLLPPYSSYVLINPHFTNAGVCHSVLHLFYPLNDLVRL